MVSIMAYSLGADTTFTRADLFNQHRITPTANITITMPIMEPSDDYSIINCDDTFTITVKDSTGAITISTLSVTGDESNYISAVKSVPSVVPPP